MQVRLKLLGAVGSIAAALALPMQARADAPVGSVAGTITLAGAVPERAPLPVFKHQEICGETVTDDRFVVGPGGGVRYVAVTVEGVQGGAAPNGDAALTLDNKGCRFVPHLQVAEVGQWLDISNSDPVIHNADARMGKDTIFNVGLRPDSHVRKQLSRPGIVTVTCDVWHTWMIAYIFVADHPYHTVTDAYGGYEIRDLPPGEYKLRIWHEELGEQEKPLRIEGAKTTKVDFAFPPFDGARAEEE